MLFDDELLFSKPKEKAEVVVDMNPMVDLAFLLLTFFMLTTTFARPQALEVVMPMKSKPGEEEKLQPVKESKTITLVLNSKDQIHWLRGITDPEYGTLDYSPSGIRSFLLDRQREIEGMVVLIKPHKDCQYLHLVDILDEMNIAEVERFAIVDLSEEDETSLEAYGLEL